MMNPHISIKDAAITVTDYDNRHKNHDNVYLT